MNLLPLAAELLVYVVAARLIQRGLQGRVRDVALAMVNLAAVYGFLFHAPGDRSGTWRFVLYVALVLFQYLVLRQFAGARGGWAWAGFFAPLMVLVVMHYVPLSLWAGLAKPLGLAWRGRQQFIALTGLSYLAFRCSRLALEVRNGVVPRPGLWEYLHFAFFLPTMSMGPINTYANYRRGFANPPADLPTGRALLRLLVGLVKFQILGGLCNQLTYQGLLLDEHAHHWVDLPVAMVFYYLYLYCNFSGFCDMAIGAAGFIGIPVPENFDHPFAARNIRDFWNRWHITLSVWMRDVVFAPLSKFLVGWFGPARANHAIAVTITVVFLLVGIWHGVGWHYAIYGAVHALGVVANHYYTIFLKQRLGREGFKAYNENRWIRAAAVTLTFMYCAASLLFFANSLDQIRQIFHVLRW